MLDLRVGDRVVYQGRTVAICGFTPHSVHPPRIWLKDPTEPAAGHVEIVGWDAIAALPRVPNGHLDESRGPT